MLPHMYINILLDTALDTDRCLPTKMADQLDLFLLQSKELWDDLDDQSQQSSSLWVNQSANYGICRPAYLAVIGGYTSCS